MKTAALPERKREIRASISGRSKPNWPACEQTQLDRLGN
jgi:hypothetical protein